MPRRETYYLLTPCPQAAFPSPFYFFDELDASLDTVGGHPMGCWARGMRSAADEREQQSRSGRLAAV